MRECKTLQEVIYFRYKELEIEAVYQDGKVIFYCNDEQEGYDDAVLEFIQAKQEFMDIPISYTKFLQAERWVKDRIYSIKK